MRSSWHAAFPQPSTRQAPLTTIITRFACYIFASSESRASDEVVSTINFLVQHRGVTWLNAQHRWKAIAQRAMLPSGTALLFNWNRPAEPEP